MAPIETKDKLSIREAAGRLLARRPDLASQRPQRKRARQIADSVGMRTAPVDVLSGWLGNNADLDVRDLEVALEDRVQLRLAALAPRDRIGADQPGFRARIALDLGWEVLNAHGPREILRILALVDGGPLAREVVSDAAEVGASAVEDVIWSGFVRHDEKERVLEVHGDVLEHLASQQDPRPAQMDRVQRFALAVRRHLAIGRLDDARLDRAAGLAIDLAEREGEPGLVASLTHRQAERMRRLGRAPESRVWLDRAFAAAEQAPAGPMRGLLEVDRGLLALREGNNADAVEHFERAVEELELADQDERPGAAEALERARLCLGEALAASGQLSRAEGELQEVVRLLQRRCNESLAAAVDESDPEVHQSRLRGLRSSLAHSFRALGWVLLMRGDISGALIRLHEAREDWLDLSGPDDPDGAAFALALAGALRAAGRFSEVEEPLEAARVLSGGDMDRPALASLPVALHDLGVAAGDRGDHAAAATLLDESVMLASSLLTRDDPLLARISYTRGLLYLAEGELGRAEDKFESVLNWNLGVEDQAEALRALARAALAWTRSREGAHRHHEAEQILAEAEDALAASRGAASTTTAHIRILRESLRE